MFRYFVCLSALAGVVWLVKSGLYRALDAYGFWPYMTICGVATAFLIVAAFAWDYFERSSSTRHR